MKKLKNPFVNNIFHYYFLVYERLNPTWSRVLDYGCGEGVFLKGLAKTGLGFYGFDVDRDKVLKLKREFGGKVKYVAVGQKLPYKDNFFDAVFMLHVLEHVDSERKAVGEAYRVLRKSGTLFISSPYKGFFSWTDAANIRYRFPRLHKLLYRMFLGDNEYKKQFVEKKKNNLFGDCTISRNWHKHYKEDEIKRLLRGKFQIEEFQKFSLFQPPLIVLYYLSKFLFKRENKLFVKLIKLDNQLKAGENSNSMLVVAKKL